MNHAGFRRWRRLGRALAQARFASGRGGNRATCFHRFPKLRGSRQRLGVNVILPHSRASRGRDCPGRVGGRSAAPGKHTLSNGRRSRGGGDAAATAKCLAQCFAERRRLAPERRCLRADSRRSPRKGATPLRAPSTPRRCPAHPHNEDIKEPMTCACARQKQDGWGRSASEATPLRSLPRTSPAPRMICELAGARPRASELLQRLAAIIAPPRRWGRAPTAGPTRGTRATLVRHGLFQTTSGRGGARRICDGASP